MKKVVFFITLGYFGTIFSQEKSGSTVKDSYNRWSVEVSFGQNQAIRPFANGYFSSDPSKLINFSGINHSEVGVRYMLSNIFGLKVDFGNDQFSNLKSTGSLPFDTKQSRIGLQGVINLGNLLQFKSFIDGVGVLAHGGVHGSYFNVKTGSNEGLFEKNYGLMFGITPQVRLARRLALTADFTIINNLRQHLNWDGSTSNNSDNLSGLLYNTSLGLTVYLGKNDKHADWYVQEDSNFQTNYEMLKRIEIIENQLNDTDRDGVVDYLDVENNTPTGVSVDSKGRFVDVNRNGVPDEMESNIDRKTATESIAKLVSADRDLVENGLVNVFFDVNSDIPNAGSTNNLFTIIHYLKTNLTTKVKLFGYADARGDEKFNKDLSQRRAQSVYNILLSAGVDKNRVTIEGIGVDTMYSFDAKMALDLARRVSIEIIK